MICSVCWANLDVAWGSGFRVAFLQSRVETEGSRFGLAAMETQSAEAAADSTNE